MNQLIASVLKEILKLFDMECNGEKVQIDEVEIHTRPRNKLRKNTDTQHFYYNVANLQEPRLRFVEHFLVQHFPFIIFKYQGAEQPVNGFRIKNLAHWNTYSFDNIYNYLGVPSSYCNCRCEICYEDGNPLPCAKVKCFLSKEEAATRLKYANREENLGLPTIIGVYGEPFLNPDLLDLFAMAQGTEKDRTTITTNASLLTEEMCQRISEFEGVGIVFSVNSLTPENRQKVMCDAKKDGTANALKALEYLKKYRIPFEASIVGWPVLELRDIEQTILKLCAYEPSFIRVCLPGFNRFNRADQETDMMYWRWDELVKLVQKLKPQVPLPLTTIPAMYKNGTQQEPVIDGVFKGSPAYEKGIRVNDLVVAFENEPIYLKSQLASRLSESVEKNAEQVTIRIFRDNEEFETTLVHSKAYSFVHAYPWGIFLNQTFKLLYLDKLKKAIEKYQASDVVVFTSEIMAPIITEMIASVDYYQNFFACCNLHLEICPHYFWGGNILLNDLHMVSDFKRRIGELKQERKIDLVVIPSSTTDDWGLDLLGDSIYELESFGIPLEIIQCELVRR